MTSAIELRTGTVQRIPDILDCLAQLSNDEVPTPPKIAREMLDLLPDEVWTNPDYRWLDPFCKSGVFLREAAKRLLDGLAGWEPDFQKRREHIYRNMLWGASITEMTGHISRRTLYYSRDASGEHSVVRFDSAEGNLPFVPAEHDFEKGRCAICGAPEDLERGQGRENYAYSFIHGRYPTKEMETMKFDVIVGNPPYQIASDGGTRTVPVYQHFVRQAIEMAPRYVVMITPSRWFASGLGLDEYRASMLADRRIRKLVDYPNAGDVFPGVEVKGGVSYFLWDREYEGDCEVTTIRGSDIAGPFTRNLGEHDIFVRDSRAITILRKVLAHKAPSIIEILSVDKEFGWTSNFSGFHSRPGADDVQIFYIKRGRRSSGWIHRSDITKSRELVDKWKVMVPKAYGAGEGIPHQVLGQPFVAAAPSVCTQSYLFFYVDSERAARSIETYLRTRFFRFLVSLRKITQHATRSSYTWVPQQRWDRDWTDADLYELYELTDEEIAFIETQVKEMPPAEGPKA